jgi:cytochrome b subunit of formate dehydrogenase
MIITFITCLLYGVVSGMEMIPQKVVWVLSVLGVYQLCQMMF